MGRIFTCTIPARLSKLAAALLLCAPLSVQTVWAQQGSPEVYVDMTALPGASAAAPAPVKLKPPAPKPPQEQGMGQVGGSRLTAPQITAAPAPVTTPVTAPVTTSVTAPVVSSPVMASPVATPAPAPVVSPATAPVAAPLSAPSKVLKPAYVSKPVEMPQDRLPVKSAPPPPLAAPPAVLAAPQEILQVAPPVTTPPATPTSAAPATAPAPAPVAVPVAPTATPDNVTEELSAPTSFPLTTRIRKETNDPAVSDSSRPVPLRPGVTGNLNDDVPSRPAPDLDPEGAVAVSTPVVRDLTEQEEALPVAPVSVPQVSPQPPKPADNKTAATKPLPSPALKPTLIPIRKPSAPAEKPAAAKPEEAATVETSTGETTKIESAKIQTPPYIPPRRPSFVEKAPAELVAALRAREASKEASGALAAGKDTQAQKPAIDLNDPPPPPGPRGAKNMPAVKKAAVEAEELAEQTVKLSAGNDPLLDRLVEKDKESLIATIESMVAAREDGKPLPKPEKIKREIGSSIVKAEPLQRPYNVYRPKKDAAPESAPVATPVTTAAPENTASAESVAQPKLVEAPPLAETKTAALTPRPPPPRAQDEQAYISVPFKQGLTEIDLAISSEIEKRVLPVMNANPGWKLQIQAFASPVKDGGSSARKASLARALAVRTYLLSKGIDATRMDVRALGAESDRDPMDRVDLIVFDPAKKG